MRRPSLSYANVTATLALILALGGTSYAAVTINGADIKRKSIPLNRLKGKLPTGARGADGEPGAAGESGPQGPLGPMGAKGDPGVTGEAGIRGPKGEVGADGVPGAQGDSGPTGLPGPIGDTGPQGPTGPQGLKGNPGNDGAPGTPGAKGDTGDQGPAGLVSDTVFDASPLVGQPHGENRAVVPATGLPAGTYLVTYRVVVEPAQRYSCGIASGSLAGSSSIDTTRTTVTADAPETLGGTGTLTVLQAGEPQILYCNGATDDWDAPSGELHFLAIDQVIDGVEG